MNGKIGLEEHFAIPETLEMIGNWYTKAAPTDTGGRLLDLMDVRLAEMDKNGMDLMILSLNSPAVQGIYDRKKAVDVAKKANDTMAETIAKRPDRFRGFCALPMQDVDAAIVEMRRCVKDLGCVGVLVNGYSQVDSEDSYEYLDEARYRPFWAELEKLDVPFYLHPRDPMPCNQGMIKGHPWLVGAAWSFGVETATHALRLMCSGLFDEHPGLKIILGHLGETLPFCIWRTAKKVGKKGLKRNEGLPAKLPLTEYMLRNFWFTTSGQFRTPALWNTIMEFGADRVLFATDFPFEEVGEACEWFDGCTISERDRYKIGRQNSIDLFKLGL